MSMAGGSAHVQHTCSVACVRGLNPGPLKCRQLLMNGISCRKLQEIPRRPWCEATPADTLSEDEHLALVLWTGRPQQLSTESLRPSHSTPCMRVCMRIVHQLATGSAVPVRVRCCISIAASGFITSHGCKARLAHGQGPEGRCPAAHHRTALHGCQLADHLDGLLAGAQE
jgi:hypothetical protein